MEHMMQAVIDILFALMVAYVLGFRLPERLVTKSIRVLALIIKPHLGKIPLPKSKSPVQVVPRLRVSQSTMDKDLKDLLRRGR